MLVGVGIVFVQGLNATPEDRLSVKVEVDLEGVSLSKGAQATLVVTNVSKETIECDLWDVGSGAILQVQSTGDSSIRSDILPGMVGSRRYIPTVIKPEETVKKQFSLLKLAPSLTTGTHELEFLANISESPVSAAGRGNLEIHKGKFKVSVNP